MEETFTYDDMNRLTGITLKRPSGQDLYCSATYDALGRMISWQADDSVCFVYGHDRRRILMEEHAGGLTRAKQYWGACEYVTESDGTTTTEYTVTYLTGPYGVFGAVKSGNGSEDMYYILKDNLGSWTTITDKEGAVEQQLSYDAWGNLRNPQTWANYTQNDVFDKPVFDRGFTGHEHLCDFGLINMNGRMYDPVMSSFLSADRFVQSPTTAQGFNRYAYCMNNPLKYIDPSGWRCIGGMVGYTPNTASNFDPYMLYGGNTPLVPRDLGIRQFDTTDPIITWMEENSLHGGGGGGAKGGWYISGGEIYWNPMVSSQSDLQKLGIDGNFIGQNFTDELNHTYYSLLGYSIDMNEGNGLAGKMAPLIDEAFINYETYRKEMYLNSSSEEPEQRWTNFINVIAYDNNRKGPQEYCFNLGPIECHFVVGNTENSMKARVEQVDLDKIKPDVNNGYGFVKWPSGYDIHFVSRASYLDSNPKNSRTITLIVPPSHWDTFKNKYRAVFF